MLNLNYPFDLFSFNASYFSCRDYLLKRLSQTPLKLQAFHKNFPHALKGPQGEGLFSDWMLLSQSSTPKQLLVLQSATHGIEGFTGSAIQSDLVPIVVPFLEQNPSVGIVFVHALNPWGFAWQRRGNEHNVDLNRNFIDFAQLPTVNEGYQTLHQRIFTPTDVDVLAQLTALTQDPSQEDLYAQFTEGQYQYADGVFYGGDKPSWSRLMLEEASAFAFIQQAERIAVIDLHTGLGPFGYGEAINDHQPHSAGFNAAVAWYGDNTQSALLGDSCSAPKQGLVDYLWHKVLGDRGCFVTLEFGTYPIIQLLNVLCAEQRYHNSYQGESHWRDLNHPSVQAMRQFFYPQERSWQQQVLFRGRQMTGLALQGLLR